MNVVPTYVACLTPAGSAAIASIALRGPNASLIVESLFRPRRQTSDATSLRLGRLGDDVADEVVVTGTKDAVEIHCHGGPIMVRQLLDLLARSGAEELTWDAWLRQTCESLLQAEAAIALARAPTLRTAQILLDQYYGALEQSIRGIIQLIDQAQASMARQRLQAVLQWVSLGKHLISPWRVVLGGAPNVGKSTLINTLLGFQRSITSPIPGTTRDVVTAATAFDGWPVELADTAGISASAGGLEKQGMQFAQTAWQTADLRLWVLDAAQQPVFPADPGAEHLLAVINKADLPAAWTLESAPWPPQNILLVSALTGDGIPELIHAISQRLVPLAPPPGTALPFTGHIIQSLATANEWLSNGEPSSARAELRGLLNDVSKT